VPNTSHLLFLFLVWQTCSYYFFFLLSNTIFLISCSCVATCFFYFFHFFLSIPSSCFRYFLFAHLNTKHCSILNLFASICFCLEESSKSWNCYYWNFCCILSFPLC
jgi:hypothetical protein